MTSFVKFSKTILSFILIISLLLGISACAPKKVNEENRELQKIRFVLEWTPNTNHTGVYAAKALGYYEQEGLDVEILAPPDGGAASLVAAGRAEFGVEVQEVLAAELTAETPLPITAVASIIQHNTSGLISLKEAGIDDFSKLEGVTYASWDAPTELAILRQTMTDAGADFQNLNTVPAPATDALALLRSGSVDVIWVYEAWDVCAAQIADVDYNFLRFGEQTPVLDFYTPLIVANNDFLEADPDAVKRFLAATARGYEYAVSHPKEAADILVTAVPELSPELVEASQQFLAEQYIADAPKWGVFDEARWTAFYDWMYEQELIPTPLGSRGFTNEYLPE